ncbi:MAG TPA: 50S ribosomal protein L25/general stress protein Ctc [Bacteroidia bacterium]|nr:50S ribosomal protein L25/general stress protein Ctc [Bacteroidia bacterium]
MKTVSISGSPRVNVGKKDAKALRNEGRVPCVIYGGKEQLHFSALEKDFKPLVYSPDVHSVKLDIGGNIKEAILQEIQYHKIKDHILHVDFLEVIPGKSVVMNLPVKTKGNSAGVKAGGKLNKKLRTLKVRGLVENIPEDITLDVEALEINDSIKVGDIKIKGLELLDAPNVTVVAVQVTRAVVEEVKPAAGAATPAAGAAAATPAAGAAAAPKADAKKPDAKK